MTTLRPSYENMEKTLDIANFLKVVVVKLKLGIRFDPIG